MARQYKLQQIDVLYMMLIQRYPERAERDPSLYTPVAFKISVTAAKTGFT